VAVRSNRLRRRPGFCESGFDSLPIVFGGQLYRATYDPDGGIVGLAYPAVDARRVRRTMLLHASPHADAGSVPDVRGAGDLWGGAALRDTAAGGGGATAAQGAATFLSPLLLGVAKRRHFPQRGKA